MHFFQPAFLPTEASIFHQLLSELDQSEQQKTCAPRRHARCQPQETFTPRFDVTETASSYELFGEVAGLAQENLSLEFSDAQTLVIKGKTQRAVPSTQAAAVTPAQPETAQQPDADASSEKSHNVTVEDEYDEADTPLATPATTTTATVAESQQAAEKQQEAQAQVPKPRYWVSERRVGSFARSFSFSQRIEQDEVTANLKNGVLHVIVPKSVKTKKVAVNVQ